MPIVGHFSGGMDFSALAYELSPAVGVEGEEGFKPANAIRWGKWLNSIISLLTVGLVLFYLGKAKIRAMGAAPDPAPTADQTLLAEIRDALKK